MAQHPSTNFSERRGNVTPDLIVLHYTAMATAPAALDRLCDPEREVSAHYLISERGHIIQLVAEEFRAWHAGAGAWGNCKDVNSQSIGIELANDGITPFSAAQMDALEHILAGIMERWSIPAERVIGHSDMAPARKSDPGMRFDWRRLALSGHSVWPNDNGDQAVDKAGFEETAKRFGYPTDIEFDSLLGAFRLRFRPWETGPLDTTDMALVTDLARRFPVDQPAVSP
ncbi:MAG: N-acetylmuramoyl-L-alanine amidase [Paracoccaceae bacterium]